MTPVGIHHRIRSARTAGLSIGAMVAALLALSLVSLCFGRYWISPGTVSAILIGHWAPGGWHWTPTQEVVVLRIRLPRILAGALVGSALASSGAAYQTMFRNPLVSPEILGVAAGAGFGASLGILLGLSLPAMNALSFGTGLLAAVLAVAIGRIGRRGSLIVLVLGGIVIGAMFNALISATQYFANPETTLPEIAFWLFGSLARATPRNLVMPGVVVALCLVALFVVRWPLTVLSTGDDEARTLGIDHRRIWAVVIGASTLMTATVVSIAGIVGWVGLIVPHLARFVVGPSFSRLLPASALMGASYLIVVDVVARSATALDLPIGILTALIGAPFFVVLLVRMRHLWL
jgi:iron complex transport system permease protein